MALKARPFDPADHLQTEDDIVFYLESAKEGNDAKHIASVALNLQLTVQRRAA